MGAPTTRLRPARRVAAALALTAALTGTGTLLSGCGPDPAAKPAPATTPTPSGLYTPTGAPAPLAEEFANYFDYKLPFPVAVNTGAEGHDTRVTVVVVLNEHRGRLATAIAARADAVLAAFVASGRPTVEALTIRGVGHARPDGTAAALFRADYSTATIAGLRRHPAAEPDAVRAADTWWEQATAAGDTTHP